MRPMTIVTVTAAPLGMYTAHATSVVARPMVGRVMRTMVNGGSTRMINGAMHTPRIMPAAQPATTVPASAWSLPRSTSSAGK